MKTMIRKAAIASMLVLFTLTAACGGGDSKNEYPEAVNANFLSSCTSTGGSQSECQCALDGIQEEYTYQEFVELESTAVTSSDVPDKLLEIITGCIQE